MSGFQFEIFVAPFEEDFPSDMPATDVAQFLSEQKNSFYRQSFDNEIILTADTTVILGGRVINKPMDEKEAIRMLQDLSGKTHQVITGVTISSKSKKVSFKDVTDVLFDHLSNEEIIEYVQTYKPLDKAGAYGVQEWLGVNKVVNISGSFYNVMGLPTHLVYKVLKNEFGL